MPKAKDKRPYTGPAVAGPLDGAKEALHCEVCGGNRTDADHVYKVSNGDWFHAHCYEQAWTSPR